MKRLFDIIASALVILLLLPLELLIALCIVCDSRGGVFFRQVRVGKDDKDFNLLKFRTMRIRANEEWASITVGEDTRITRVGKFLRQYKLDELPQLINILKGDMSVVGPRPEVRKYVALYNDQQKRVLLVRPGLTDFASLAYLHESELLAHSDHPEKTYIEEIMPKKLALNLQYIEKQSAILDIKLILKTIISIFRS